MDLTLYQVDAFASRVFEGNPAAIIPLQHWLGDSLMQQLAIENNLSETAFFVKTETGYHIRWFTPAAEVDLCGHATLAAAFVLFNVLSIPESVIHFQSRSGQLTVSRQQNALQLDFPAMPPQPCEIPAALTEAFGRQPVACLKADDYIAVFDDEDFVRTITPNFSILKSINTRGVAITSTAKNYDFICRFFAPRHNIDEDPVTGSLFTELVPYWSQHMNQTRFHARQVSARGGDVYCELIDERVTITGNACLYMTGTISLPDSKT